MRKTRAVATISQATSAPLYLPLSKLATEGTNMAITAIPTRKTNGNADFKVILFMLREVLEIFFIKYFR